MSRTPVRDALKRLATAGFLEMTPRGGYLLRRPTVRETRETYQVRLALEEEAAELAARRASADQLVALRELAKTSDLAAGDTGVTGFPFAQVQREFHALIACAGGNPALARLLGLLSDRLTTYYVTSLHYPGRGRPRSDHQEIADAISRRDAAGARRSIGDHLAVALTGLGAGRRDETSMARNLEATVGHVATPNRQTRAERAYVSLRDASLRGEIAEGERLTEEDLAARLSISRTPVREALLQLEVEGHLERDSAGRLIARSFSPDEVACEYRAAAALEAYAARLAAERISDGELAELRQIIQIDGDTLARATSTAVRADDRFHSLVAQASRNRVLAVLVTQQRSRLPRLEALSLPFNRMNEQLIERARFRKALLVAFDDGDTEGASSLMHQHLVELGEKVAATLNRRRTPMPVRAAG